MLARNGVVVAPVDDTMIISFDLDAGRQLDGIGGGHGMDELAERHLGHTCLTFKETLRHGQEGDPFGEVPLDKATEYAAEDADVTWRLDKMLKPRLATEGGTRIYERVDRPLVPVVAQMERQRHQGRPDDRLAKLSEEFATETARLEGKSTPLRAPNSPSAAPSSWAKSCSTTWATRAARRARADSIRPTRACSSACRAKVRRSPARCSSGASWRKLKSTYTDALQQAINPETGRVHTSYSLVGAQTGRLSSTEPNLQNIPIRTEIGRQIREAFVADDGNVLLAADYSQIELRLAAHMADVPTLKEAFAHGEDIHARTAKEMFGEVNRDARGRAKTINFAILYGISRWGLAGRLGVEADEAQAMIDTYFQRFPGIQKYIVDTLEQVRERGYSETLFGRKTWFPRIKSKNQAAPGQRARGDQRADPGHQRGYHQARHGADDARARSCRAGPCPHAAAGP